MATKKTPKPARGKSKAKKKATAKAKVAVRVKKPRKPIKRKSSVKAARPAPKKKPAPRKKPAPKKKRSRTVVNEIHSSEPSTLGGRTFSAEGRPRRRGILSRSAGQSGDLQGLSRRATVDSESVDELLEEGQAREAAAISGVEDAPDPDEAEVRTREVPEDDVPDEYLDED